MAQRVTESPLIAGNAVPVLRGGDEAYPSMLAAIRNARHSGALGSYIFRDDQVGRSFIGALIDAHRRGVEVRVLIDGIGSGYILSSPLRDLKAAGIPTARFLHTWVPWRMPFLNTRNHKKLLIVDGTVGFTGGLNIGADHSRRQAAKDYVDGVQFRWRGRLLDSSWTLLRETGRLRRMRCWTRRLVAPYRGRRSVAARGIHRAGCGHVQAGDDPRRGPCPGTNRVRIVTPYFLPDQRLQFAIAQAGLRGVSLAILIPQRCDYFLHGLGDAGASALFR